MSGKKGKDDRKGKEREEPPGNGKGMASPTANRTGNKTPQKDKKNQEKEKPSPMLAHNLSKYPVLQALQITTVWQREMDDVSAALWFALFVPEDADCDNEYLDFIGEYAYEAMFWDEGLLGVHSMVPSLFLGGCGANECVDWMSACGFALRAFACACGYDDTFFDVARDFVQLHSRFLERSRFMRERGRVLSACPRLDNLLKPRTPTEDLAFLLGGLLPFEDEWALEKSVDAMRVVEFGLEIHPDLFATFDNLALFLRTCDQWNLLGENLVSYRVVFIKVLKLFKGTWKKRTIREFLLNSRPQWRMDDEKLITCLLKHVENCVCGSESPGDESSSEDDD